MSNSKAITSYRRGNQKVSTSVTLPPSFPPLDQITEITLVDHNGRPYVYRLLKNVPDTEAGALDDSVECEDLPIELSDIKDIFIILTDDQRNIVMHVYYLYKNIRKNDLGEALDDNPRIILQGPAGTGKSTVINLIEKIVTWEENKTTNSPQKLKVLKCAFTGKAASNIEGTTLNYMFSIPRYPTRNMAKKRLASKQDLLQNCIFFICDEVSMVGERLMSSVNQRLQLIFDNTKLYGNRFVLLVGDLYQIDPVKQKPVYPKSELWQCCEFYELTKIIRQDDPKFINALNNFRDSKLTNEDMDLFRSREIQNIEEVPDSVVHLCFLNKSVDEVNTTKLNKSNEKEEIVNAIEDSENWRPSNLRVKIGIRYMITQNLDVSDGLANGTIGVVKGFDYDDNGHILVIWMKFHSDKIGKKTRTEYLKNHNATDFEDCVPIQRSSIIVKLKTNPKVSRTVGKMFPLTAAEAITVHKSQGQTYHEGVCIHITNESYDKLRTDKSLQYVALTRVKRLENLYIFGRMNFFGINCDKFDRTEKELNRLRTERKLQLAYETFEDKTEDVIIYLNTGSTFNEHHEFISTDKWYGNASLLIFTETNTVGSDQIVIPNFEIAFRSDENTVLRSDGGIICYKKASKSLEVISSIVDDEDNTFLTLLLYENLVYIVAGVKGDLTNEDFVSAIESFLEDIKGEKCIFFVGNLDNEIITSTDFFNSFNIRNKLSCATSTTNGKTQCDTVLTQNFDIEKDDIGFYEYIPSSNKPIYVKIPSKTTNVSFEGDLSRLSFESYDKANSAAAGNDKPSSSGKNKIQEIMEVD